MVLVSLSIVSSSSSFPSNSDADSASTSIPNRIRPFTSSKPSIRFVKPIKFSSLRTSLPSIALVKASSNQISEDGSAELFLKSNSIADFMRFKRGVDGESAELQTAVMSYKRKFPWSLFNPFLQVDLISTIHIADKEYFKTIQEELESYDCVLYEMVASRELLENRSNPNAAKKLNGSRQRGFNILGCIQKQLARILSLDFQLDCLNYQAENWYHADLDYETFKQLQREKGESFFSFAKDLTLRSTKAILQPTSVKENLEPWRSKLLWASRVLPMPLVGLLIIERVCTDVATQASKYPEIEALSRLDFSAALKFFLAKSLTTEFAQVIADVEDESVIIGARNKRAIEALRRAIDDGHNRIAILYGGGHMPDLGRRLREELELIPSCVQWITAWSIRKRNIDTNSFPILKTMAKLSGWPLNRYQTLALLVFSSILALDLWLWELFFGTAVDWTSQLTSQLLGYVDNARVI